MFDITVHRCANCACSTCRPFQHVSWGMLTTKCVCSAFAMLEGCAGYQISDCQRRWWQIVSQSCILHTTCSISIDCCHKSVVRRLAACARDRQVFAVISTLGEDRTVQDAQTLHPLSVPQCLSTSHSVQSVVKCPLPWFMCSAHRYIMRLTCQSTLPVLQPCRPRRLHQLSVCGKHNACWCIPVPELRKNTQEKYRDGPRAAGQCTYCHVQHPWSSIWQRMPADRLFCTASQPSDGQRAQF